MLSADVLATIIRSPKIFGTYMYPTLARIPSQTSVARWYLNVVDYRDKIQIEDIKRIEMATNNQSWQAIGAAKRESILQSIPEKWRLENSTPPASELRDVTGSYIQQFLSPREIEITETDAVEIAKKTTTGQWTAVEVTRAFCHRAAIAHQLVRPYFNDF